MVIQSLSSASLAASPRLYTPSFNGVLEAFNDTSHALGQGLRSL
jgi:hypothetical protein